MPDNERNLPNFYFTKQGVSEYYRRPKRKITERPAPQRNREDHAQQLLEAFGQAMEEYRLQKELREPELAAGEPGFYLDFQLPKSELRVVESLEHKSKGIELLTVHSSDQAKETALAAVFVPDKASEFFSSKIKAYRDKDTKSGKPQNESLIASLDSISLGTARDLFTDNPILFPANEHQKVWWEVWLRHGCADFFSEITKVLQIRTTREVLRFLEREVVLALTNVETLSRIIRNNGLIAELRLAKDSPSMFFDPDMDMQEQVSWVEDLSERTNLSSDINLAVCLLDQGVTRSHRLIELVLAREDLFTYNPSWGFEDNQGEKCGHGTAMAGIILYGDLYKTLKTRQRIDLTYKLESVKILPNTGQNDPRLYGAITIDAVSQVEIKNPTRQRVFCMPVTSEGFDNTGIPSTWSAAVDQICFEFKRLMVIPVGNIRKPIMRGDYPDTNDVSPAEDPSQAWNALIVGAYTDKVNIVDTKYAGWEAIAPSGDISPNSRTSLLWDNTWPTRPDVTFEGGNLATENAHSPAADPDELRLLTTYYKSNVRQFTLFGDTSAAAAFCSYMSARIWAEHPEYWAETVRALIVHSAEWTPTMLSNLPENASQSKKIHILLRRYGYGVPNLEKALFSSKSDLTMIFEDQLQPFWKVGNKPAKTNKMNFHALPLPMEKLKELGGAEVELRLTLSYFIEPNPGERGQRQRHSYASHGLRFKIKRSLETLAEFKQRINQIEKEKAENLVQNSTDDKDDGWFLGAKSWDRSGSIHSDIWRGTAAALAERDAIAIYPVGGWWKHNSRIEGWNNIARYTLIVSIRVINKAEVDIYTPIATKVGAIPIIT
ncbi:hypothetical protein ACX27_21755 [Nostoc piscinale CENA21]|uniref:Peptidase S8/S53 domain-containing protein n=1 Tax=Nostoc piscinale CENA21 TaxID=224013 RepID=A0A0M4SZE7_9NOSO|nr:S8 family peptidase [Nostoc piscinale]ALF54859.1 hypothetical protein ACX27_21755 [Nostoc piscinale CENA21]